MWGTPVPATLWSLAHFRFYNSGISSVSRQTDDSIISRIAWTWISHPHGKAPYVTRLYREAFRRHATNECVWYLTSCQFTPGQLLYTYLHVMLLLKPPKRNKNIRNLETFTLMHVNLMEACSTRSAHWETCKFDRSKCKFENNIKWDRKMML